MTILQLLPTLTYGGVETYVVRLSAGLVRRGHRVVVASAGGPLEEKCAQQGIRTVRLSVRGSTHLLAVLPLARLIATEQVDLVNAHNWSAGAVGYLAAGLARVPFVFTIHGLRGPARRRLTFYWSRKVVVVSERSRQHLIERFGLAPGRIITSFVGVDTDEFVPRPPSDALRRLLGLEPDSKVILHVSRFSRGKVPVALALIEAMPAIENSVPRAQVLLIGDGPLTEAVRRCADDMNARLRRTAAVFVEARRDISQVMSLPAAVVGTATVALEAMACGVPVVAAGKGGFVGVLTPERFESAETTCFGDHVEPGELPQATAEGLAEALIPLLTDSALHESLSRFGRERVVSSLSAGRLAEHMETIYREATNPSRPGSILLLHSDRIGDLLSCLPALKALRAAFPSARIASLLRPHLAPLLCSSPYVDQVITHSAWTSPWPSLAVLSSLRRFSPDLVINFSSSAAATMLTRLCGAPRSIGFADACLSRLFSIRVQAFGPLNPAKAARLAETSGAAAPDLSYVGLIRLPPQDYQAAAALLETHGLGEGERLVAIAPGAFSGSHRHKAWTVAGFAEVAQRLWTDHGMKSVIVGSGHDAIIAQRIISRVTAPVVSLAGETSTGVLACVLGRCSMAVAIDSGPMRVAAAMGCPVVALLGPTDPRLTGPRGAGHVIVQPASGGPRGRTMADISADQVLAAASQVIARLPVIAPR